MLLYYREEEEDLFNTGAVNEADPEEERGAQEVEAGEMWRLIFCLYISILYVYIYIFIIY
jgi:hypothetical protein